MQFKVKEKKQNKTVEVRMPQREFNKSNGWQYRLNHYSLQAPRPTNAPATATSKAEAEAEGFLTAHHDATLYYSIVKPPPANSIK